MSPNIIAFIAVAAFAAFIIIKLTASKKSKPTTDEAGHGPCENCDHIGFNMFETDSPHIDGECRVERQCRKCGDVSFVSIPAHLHDELCLNGAIDRR